MSIGRRQWAWATWAAGFEPLTVYIESIIRLQEVAGRSDIVTHNWSLVAREKADF